MKYRMKMTQWIGIIFIIQLCSFFYGNQLMNDVNDHVENEPKVTYEESLLIQDAISIYTSNPKQGIEYLIDHMTPHSSAVISFTLANFYFQNDELGLAEKYYANAIQKLPDFYRAHSQLAQVYWKQNRLEDSLKELQQILSLGISDLSSFTLMGYIYLQKDEAMLAEMAYRQAILLKPDEEQTYLGLAQALWMQNRNQELISLLKPMIEKNPSQAQLWHLLANAYRTQDENIKAIEILETMKHLGLSDHEGLATLGDLYLQAHMTQDAIEIYLQAMNQGQLSLDRALNAIEGLLQLSEIEKAKTFIQSLIEWSTETMSEKQKLKKVWLEGRIAYMQDQFEQAKKYYEQALDMDPLQAKVLMSLGELYQEQDQLEKALIFYEQAESDLTFKKQALLKQTQVEIDRGQYLKASQNLEKILMDDYHPLIEKYLEQIKKMIH